MKKKKLDIKKKKAKKTTNIKHNIGCLYFL